MLESEPIIKQIEQSDTTGKEVSFVLIKPDGFKMNIMKEFEENLRGNNVDIIASFPVYLDEQAILGIFRNLILPSEFGDGWKKDVITTLQEGPSIAYILNGVNTVQNALNVRNQLRNKYTNRTNYAQRVVKNLIHAEDSPQEASISARVALERIDYFKAIEEYVRNHFYGQEDTDNAYGLYHHSVNVGNLTKEIIYDEHLQNEEDVDVDVDEGVTYVAGLLHDVGKTFKINRTTRKIHAETKKFVGDISWLPNAVRNSVENIIFDATRSRVKTTEGKVLYDANIVDEIRQTKEENKVSTLHYMSSIGKAATFLRN